MKILGFETSSGRCSVAISDGVNILATELILENSLQAENLTNMISKALSKLDFKLVDIDYIATTNGPGSFTGIRIGLSAALGLSMASKIEPVIFSNFAIINYRIREQYRNFDFAVAIIDAYRDELYLQVFDRQNNSVTDPKLLNIDEAKDFILSLKGKIVSGGSGVAKIQELNNITILPRFPFPDARSVCRLASSQIAKGVYSKEIEPLYIRLPDAKLGGLM
ncbi:MAG UNVERIFIED_CONTAM: tRNA (adenosine(37)-N6)-threonylcarbamoyltransferase complex dimerization subunit type 1 TsaB [Rickettsiaceae bacterium]|jgi:tRNA threonylcarbamoyl adenosine modification protein YeaZ